MSDERRIQKNLNRERKWIFPLDPSAFSRFLPGLRIKIFRSPSHRTPGFSCFQKFQHTTSVLQVLFVEQSFALYLRPQSLSLC